MKVCKNCGVMLSDEAVDCGFCGCKYLQKYDEFAIDDYLEDDEACDINNYCSHDTSSEDDFDMERDTDDDEN